MSLAAVAPATAALVVSAAIGTSLGPAAVLDISDYEFTSGTAVSDGRYATLGDSDGRFYLRPCNATADVVIGVSSAAVGEIRYVPGQVQAATASLSEILIEGRTPVGDPCR